MSAGSSGNSPNNSHIVSITIAIVGALGLIIAAWIGPQVVVNVNQQGQATAAAELQPTIDSLQNVPTATARLVEITKVVVVTQLVEVTREVPAAVVPVQTITPLITPSGSLKPGQTFNQDGMKLTLSKDFGIKDPKHILVLFSLENNTSKDIVIQYDDSHYTAKDSLGRDLGISLYFNEDACRYTADRVMKTGEYYQCGLLIEADLSAITEIQITASDIARIKRAEWTIPIDVH